MDPSVHVQNLSTTSDLCMEKNYPIIDLATNSDPTVFLQDYSTISDSKFHEKLVKSIGNTMNQDELIELLNQKDLFIFIRHLTELVNKLKYAELQHEQWSYYQNLGMNEGIWNGRVSKKVADANSMCHTYGRSKNLIKQRIQTYKLQCEKIQEAINEHMKQAPVNINLQNMTTIINNLIQNDQYELQLELNRRKTMLRLDAEEHKLVEHFYQMKPRQTEIKSAKVIFKATHEQQNIIHEIAIFKKWLEVHTQAPSYTLQDVQLPKIYHIFISLSFQYQTSSAEHIAEQTIMKAEELVESYSKIINNEKNKLQCTRPQHKNVQQLDQIISIINQREQNLKQRRDSELLGKLSTFFFVK
ncbi:unnamed protein product [Rotaria sp. Silwood2]|nr:unnamed protein product [Rotaria sp. Silwood2]CAF3382574.1 unnamed protein product [Rotaria sp. Silwood2]CAF4526546.1 unnamed protein product [Rotaria sp. Silwood2]